MNDIINLDNNYYIDKLNQNNQNSINTIDICHLNLIKVIKSENLILKIDFDEFDIKEYKKILKKLLFLKNIAMLIKKDFGIRKNEKKLIAYAINFFMR